ncbi:MAG: thiamine pyrophosphate-dependent enzyme [Coriobacteriia bacterium]|nr:thiamine pyrophosphate-dependent enzyme [Coriobacteriia bacterium]
MKQLMSGNEAIAQGAWEAGCFGGFGYPGTPSSEILEALAVLPEVYAEWAPNEKVALESAIGASLAGARALVTMKHVGVNVAADPLMTLSYTGVTGGLVIVAADDPGMHSSQNEQDSRNYAKFARVPMLDPADAQEALDMTKFAFELSEQFDTAVFIRPTMRISHTESVVEIHERKVLEQKAYEKDASKWVMMPAFAIKRRPLVDKRMDELTQFVETSPFNKLELRDTKIGFICSGAVFQHAREALPEASSLKLGFSWPLPQRLIQEFFDAVEKVYVLDEADQFFLHEIQALGFKPESFPYPLKSTGELSPRAIREALGLHLDQTAFAPIGNLPARPPALCPACPHRLVFFELRRMRAVVTGDIGCYTLGALPPLSVQDSVVCMGASVSMAHGFELAKPKDHNRPVFGLIGDSTFAHSGIVSLINTYYNGGSGNIIILDNRTTGMTGGQGNPVNGITLQNRASHELKLIPLIKGIGIEHVVEVPSGDQKAIRNALKESVNRADELCVTIVKGPCVVEYKVKGVQREVIQELCTKCGICSTLGCPAIGRSFDGYAFIDETQCMGCTHCEQICSFGAIKAVRGEL